MYPPTKGAALSGLYTIATVSNGGTSILRNSTHLPAMAGSMSVNPVMFAPGRAREATMPLAIGSVTLTNTIGIEFVAARSALTANGSLPRAHPRERRPTPQHIAWRRSDHPQATCTPLGCSDRLSSRISSGHDGMHQLAISPEP